MADVTINQLPDISPSPTTVVPISNGVTTGKTLSNNLGVPVGTIVMWSNYQGASIPTGWALCDGQSGRPDLRNRFVIGSGSSYSLGNTGGTADAIVVAHTHTASSSVNDPGHGHSITCQNTGAYGASITHNSGQRGPVTRFTNNATTGISVSTSITSTGSSGTNANLPPYFALAFIIKIA